VAAVNSSDVSFVVHGTGVVVEQLVEDLLQGADLTAQLTDLYNELI